MTSIDKQEERYRVVNLYDVDYLVDENNVAVLLATKPPSIEDMKAIAEKFNAYDHLLAENKRLREALGEALTEGQHGPMCVCWKVAARAALKESE